MAEIRTKQNKKQDLADHNFCLLGPSSLKLRRLSGRSPDFTSGLFITSRRPNLKKGRDSDFTSEQKKQNRLAPVLNNSFCCQRYYVYPAETRKLKRHSIKGKTLKASIYEGTSYVKHKIPPLGVF